MPPKGTKCARKSSAVDKPGEAADGEAGHGMDRDAVKKMLGYLTYQCSDRCKAPADKKDLAADALERYRGLSGDHKAEFLTKFQQNKDLAWFRMFQQCEQQTSAHNARMFDGYLNRNEILRMNAFDANVMNNTEADTLCQALIEQSEFEFEYKSDTVHHDNPLLCKYLYKKSKGLEHVDTTSSQACFATATETDLGKFNAAALKTFASSSTDKVVVKIENMAWHNFKQKVSVLKSAKLQLEKRLTELGDVHTRLEMKNDVVLAPMVADVSTAIVKLGGFVGEVRTWLVRTEGADENKPFDELQKRIDKVIGDATTHNDGAKMQVKRMRALL